MNNFQIDPIKITKTDTSSKENILQPKNYAISGMFAFDSKGVKLKNHKYEK